MIRDVEEPGRPCGLRPDTATEYLSGCVVVSRHVIMFFGFTGKICLCVCVGRFQCVYLLLCKKYNCVICHCRCTSTKAGV